MKPWESGPTLGSKPTVHLQLASILFRFPPLIRIHAMDSNVPGSRYYPIVIDDDDDDDEPIQAGQSQHVGNHSHMSAMNNTATNAPPPGALRVLSRSKRSMKRMH